ncbi:endoribonuclease Dicer [Toxorhynchites rutilus septentrionalis]|uniref:endoribonuclease Dicer n=1 Tax=Toxorhynchites rutilus septentrionalis TaxID=329112 RepID=UPI0024796498|nr:endoribonuclease Dicer [Toxorhynchites rutilus septentrionalis]
MDVSRSNDAFIKGSVPDDFTPRDYQRQMKEICMKKNTIVYLPTGAGKTHIALMVLKDMGRDLVKPLTEGGKRSFFIVNTVALAKQQAEFIGRNVPYATSIYTSDRNVDTWKQDQWLAEFAKYQIIVCTCQILLDVMKHGYLSLKHINLIVFDECHHGVGDHPMHGVMEQFLRVPKSEQPRVIGLSGMLLYKELKLVEQVAPQLERLENTFYATIATVGSVDEYTEVCKFSTNPSELLLSYSATIRSATICTLQKCIDDFAATVACYHLPKYSQQNKSLQRDMPKPKKVIVKNFNELKFHMDEMGLFGGSIALLGLIVQFELDKRTSDSSALRLLYRSCITFCESLRHQMEKLMSGIDIKEKLTMFSSTKVRQLIARLEDIYKGHDDNMNMKTLIFVERRYTAKVLYHLLKIYFSLTDNVESIVPDFMVGSNGTMPESIDQILNAKKDRKVLERFRKNETNTIITTRVLEEGIDLQMCNVVIKYDHPQTFASYEQSKGRARMKNSSYVVMLDNSKKDDFVKKYRLYKAIETELQRCLVGKTINRPEPLESDVHNELCNELIPPFYTSKGAKLDALSSIQLLNRYCMGMPRDAFTNTNVSWERTDLKNGHVIVSVLLPLQSTIKEKVSGNPMPNIKLAKRSAAFNACKKLYEHSELNEHLIPIDSKRKLDTVADVYFNHWKEFSKDPPKTAGTQKCVRNHAIVYPQETTNCCPQPGRPCYIYILRVTAGFTEDIADINTNIFQKLYDSENNYGIMTTKPLPVLAKMKCFVTLGLINVHLDETPITLSNAGSAGELERLRHFHVMIFRDMLKLWKQFLVYDYSNEANSFLVVPLKNSQYIDWDLVKVFQQLKEPPSELAVWVREKAQFDPNCYRHRVILPWYKTSRDRNYVVTIVHEHMTPKSPFPNLEYSSYEDYFKQTYHQQVVKHDQFLIEVKGITTHLNLLRPGMDDDGKKARAKNRRYNEILIPELCHNYQVPADYWLKATLLPSALHRLHYLLLAEKIRVDLATSIGVGCRENLGIKDLDVEYTERDSASDLLDPDGLQFGEDSDSEDEDDENDGFDYENFKESLDKPLDLNELMRNQLNSFSGEIQLPWAEEEEPVDIDRNWDQVSKIDLDYYDSFLRKFTNLDVSEKIASQLSSCYSIATRDSPEKVKALMDAPLEMKFDIKILHLKLKNTANINLQQSDIIKALTTKSSGDVFDLERYEILGDAFLKFAVSVYLVKKHQDWHEGFLTAVKGRIVSNRNLVYCAMQYGLPGMLKVHTFDPKNDWQPPLATVPTNIKRAMAELEHSTRILYRLTVSEEEIKKGAIQTENFENFITELDVQKGAPDKSPMQNYISQQGMGDKTPADAVEALLGVCVSSVGIQRSFKVLSHFKILPKADNLLTLLEGKIDGNRLKTNITSRETDAFLVSHARIEKILNYTFRDRTYLLQALTHASYPTNRITGSYEQLEFLGDAVLDFLISAYIYEQNPTMNPGQLTDLRSALVNNVTLACVLVRYGLHLYILSESASLTDSVNRFVTFQEKQQHKITDQVNLLVEENDRKMAEFVDVPKALGDVFESLIGAIFLDSGNDLEATWKVIYGLLHQEIIAFTNNTPMQIIRQLYEFKPGCSPSFSQAIVDDDTVMVKLHYTIRNQKHLAYGFGQNKDDAKRAAAKAALQVLHRRYD